MRELTHREMQLAELSILLDFREICEKNGLDMHLMSGTLLGAIRHKGFIPWDDDIDVCLSRPEYDKLIEIFKNGVDKDYLELLSFETGNFNRTFIKIIDKRTYVDNSDSFLNDGNAESLWIDVFPIDGFPANDRKAELVCKVLAILRTLIHLQNAKLGKSTNPIRAVAKGVGIMFTRIVGGDNLIRLAMRIIKTIPFEKAKYVGDIAYTYYGVGERMKKEEFLDTCQVEFEGHMFTAVKSWDKYLTNLYGDYMKLPPEEDRQITRAMHAFEL